jgi:hypothetical protein
MIWQLLGQGSHIRVDFFVIVLYNLHCLLVYLVCSFRGSRVSIYPSTYEETRARFIRATDSMDGARRLGTVAEEKDEDQGIFAVSFVNTK